VNFVSSAQKLYSLASVYSLQQTLFDRLHRREKKRLDCTVGCLRIPLVKEETGVESAGKSPGSLKFKPRHSGNW